MVRLRLNSKITIAVAALVAALIAAIATGTAAYYRRQLRSAIARDQAALLSAVAADIEFKLHHAHAMLIANAEAMPASAARDVDAAQRFLDGRVSLLQIFDNHIGLFTPQGIEITESPADPARRGKDFSHRAYIRETVATRRPHLSSPYRSSQAHGHPAVMLTAPVVDAGGEMVAILAGSIDLLQANILGQLAETPIGGSGYLYLTTADRVMIMHPDRTRILSTVERGGNALYDRAIDERFEGTDVTVNTYGARMVTTFRRLTVNDWLLASNYPHDEAFAPVARMERAFLLGTLAVIAVLVVVVSLLVRHFTAPLAAFTRHVAALPRARGDARFAPVSGDDEIGTLARAFNGMVAEIDQQQQALREEEERYRELADSLPETVFETDARGVLRYANRAGREAFGFDAEEVARGIEVLDLVAPVDRERARSRFRERLEGRPRQADEYLMVRRDGVTFPATVHATRIVRDGRVDGLRGILVNDTDRRQLESERLRAQKLESIGVLAGGIAHDFNNVLSSILGNLSVARAGLDPADPITSPMEEARSGALHARDLAQQLLTFARGGAPVTRAVAIEPLLRNAAALAAGGTSVRVELEVADGVHAVRADATQVGQAFNNLLINACQAMPGGGIVRVAADDVRLGAGGSPPLPPGDYVRVRVIDHGPGIPAELLPRIFDPYFTTKQAGSGLGLAVVYSVVRAHGGHVAAASTPGAGATFTVHLPAADERAAPELPSAAAPRGAGRILVMDDEALLRRVFCSSLRTLGYEPEAVADGEEAIRRYREALAEGRPFRAVVMDLTVRAGLGGREAVRELLRVDPGARALVASGYSNDPVMADFRAFGFAGVLKKPFELAELGQALRDALGEDG